MLSQKEIERIENTLKNDGQGAYVPLFMIKRLLEEVKQLRSEPCRSCLMEFQHMGSSE